ncbi:RagB/SusD family nutrient uptake outer membrane protein [Hyunsoonleella flava]|uniref:RagB/SusD family nutrient uptake outer membrane protein n=1 Tax=Hyunsoonleella flava TaxID=2527939 RepID=A0A4Q9FDX2_9FLAO|nr:RagB/SusD family nutrient uptake outer membrane protein [Hyunsoonleella flava]TBN03966.1 RagB/SusD family nutrient uptake outer membrane protein [Hyunsoonleella flava]
MKSKFKYFIILILTLTVTVSCDEEFLEPEPLSFLSPDNTLVDATGFDALLITLRKELRWQYDGERSGICSQSITTDIGFAPARNNRVPRNLPLQFTPNSDGGYKMLDYFNRAYSRPISTANLLLFYADRAGLDSEDERNSITAAAYFHRSYWYYQLVHLYGDVPFVGQVITGPKLDYFTHARKTILDKIESDMEFAVQWLPESNVAGGETKWAGYHLLTKIQLANSHFTEAVQSATEIIDGPFSLVENRFGVDANNPDRDYIWDLARPENVFNGANTETILGFVDRFDAPQSANSGGSGRATHRDFVPAWWNGGVRDSNGARGSIDRIRGVWTTMIDTIGRGNAWSRATPYYIYEMWDDANDLRRSDGNWVDKDELVYNNPSSADHLQPVNPNNFGDPAQDSLQFYYAFPHYKTFIAHDESDDSRPDGGFGNGYIYRLAGTYLLRAEANYWLGNTGAAADDINEVRSRANASDISGGDVTIEKILEERAKELYLEEPRKVELTRIALIMADNNLNGYSIDNLSEKSFYFDHVIDKNIFYQVGSTIRGVQATIEPRFVLWPIPAATITNNSQGVINQNIGFPGAEQNIPPLTVIDDSQ